MAKGIALSAIRSYKLSIGQHVLIHGTFKLSLVRSWGEVDGGVEGVELEVIVVCTAGRARACITRLAGTVAALLAAVRKLFGRGHTFGKRAGSRRKAV